MTTVAEQSERVAVLRELEGEVGVLIRRIRRVIGERAREVHPDLVPSSYLMLGHIRDHGPLRASELSSTFDIDKGAISRQVQHLIDLELLDRAPDPDDGRATLLSVSPEGRRRLEAVASERSAMLAARLQDWAPADIEQVVVSLRRYNEALDA